MTSIFIWPFSGKAEAYITQYLYKPMQKSKVQQEVSMFCLGVRDSLSLYWLRKILFLTHPINKNIHPSSLKLLSTLKNTFIQVFFFLIALPSLFKYFGQDFLAKFVSIFFLILTYGYLFFYNTDVMTTTKEVSLWACRFPNTHFCKFDHREKAELFYSLSNQVKGFIFLLLYYTPIFLVCLVLSSYFPTLGTFCLLISQAFFNSAFYFLKKWPYDRYNVGFMELNLSYMLGYGFFVSLVCNVILSGEWARAMYFLISQWMIINSILFGPPKQQFESVEEVFECFKSSEKRAQLPNGYNQHRQCIRKQKQYRSSLLKQIFLLKPALKITEYLNDKLAQAMQGNNPTPSSTAKSDCIMEAEEGEED